MDVSLISLNEDNVGIQHLTKEDLEERRNLHAIMYVLFTVLACTLVYITVFLIVHTTHELLTTLFLKC
jgi:uncharacterized membrane protein